MTTSSLPTSAPVIPNGWPPSVAEVLRVARGFIDAPEKMVRDRFCLAEDEAGREVDPLDDSAVRFCVCGAVRRALGGYDESSVPYHAAFGSMVANDWTYGRIGHTEVMAAFAQAATLARSTQPAPVGAEVARV